MVSLWLTVGPAACVPERWVKQAWPGCSRLGEEGAEDTARRLCSEIYTASRILRVSSGSSPPPEPRIAWWTSPLHDSAEDRTRVHKNAAAR